MTEVLKTHDILTAKKRIKPGFIIVYVKVGMIREQIVTPNTLRQPFDMYCLMSK